MKSLDETPKEALSRLNGPVSDDDASSFLGIRIMAFLAILVGMLTIGLIVGYFVVNWFSEAYLGRFN